MVFRFAGFELDQHGAELRAPDGGTVKLRPKTLEMLRLFAANPGRALSKQVLIEAVWPKVYVSEDSLFQCIRELRAALGDDRRQIIKLVSGGGYVLTALNQGSSVGPASAVQAAASLAPFSKGTPPLVAVLPIVDASDDPRGAAMATEVTAHLTDGFARIDGIRVVAPRSAEPARHQSASASSLSSDFEVHGELRRDRQSWAMRARMIRTATGEIQAIATVSVDASEPDGQLQQSRLAAGAGYPLARRLNELLEAKPSETPPATGDPPAGGAKVVIEQALALINQTTRERFGMAQVMLRQALADEPDNVDIAVTLAALQLRGIQMVWHSPDEAIAAESEASATLERALRMKPNYIPVLETYGRFLIATNRFVESIVTCARALSLDPWNGLALYLTGLGQLHLGRFEDALQTFRQADRFDTPQVSRWTWCLGAGWANLLMDNGEAAVPWLRRSIAITAGSGRTHMLLAAACQQVGRIDDAKAAMQAGLTMRPGTTALNVAPPEKNASPVYVHAAHRVIRLMVAAGLPER
jgi:DNA-binding winged helix-turn-helix (wHTH) protein/tetratricopeptide (TPR) repeat protein